MILGPPAKMIVVVMGVSGSGKTTIGKLLAQRLGCEFLDGDDFHPPGNVAKMAAGTPLTDEDRQPWLEGLNRKLRGRTSAVVACSALKQSYRETLARELPRCTFVFLDGSLELIRSRLGKRSHRYMPASLLESQFATLEPPQAAIGVDIADSVQACVDSIASRLAR